jgi:hypothetical protein
VQQAAAARCPTQQLTWLLPNTATPPKASSLPLLPLLLVVLLLWARSRLLTSTVSVNTTSSTAAPAAHSPASSSPPRHAPSQAAGADQGAGRDSPGAARTAARRARVALMMLERATARQDTHMASHTYQSNKYA